jgi:hypothetical protein
VSSAAAPASIARPRAVSRSRHSRSVACSGSGPPAARTRSSTRAIAGAIIGTHLGDQYAFAATTFGTRGSDVPHPDTLEGLLSTLPHARTVIDSGSLAAALDRKLTPRIPADHTYFSLDPATTDQIDAIVSVKEI